MEKEGCHSCRRRKPGYPDRQQAAGRRGEGCSRRTDPEAAEEAYGIEKEDLMSAELEVVPAGKARDCGLDSSMILAYGQDDRVCTYTSLAAMLEIKHVKRTSCCILVDKEEIGSVGATGMHSRFFENAVADLMDKMGCFSELRLRHTLANSTMISSDVGAAYDPMYADVYDKKSSSFLEGTCYQEAYRFQRKERLQ